MALHKENVLNMGILKMVNLNEVGLSAGAKTVIARALTDAKNEVTKGSVRLEREMSRKLDRRRTI